MAFRAPSASRNMFMLATSGVIASAAAARALQWGQKEFLVPYCGGSVPESTNEGWMVMSHRRMLSWDREGSDEPVILNPHRHSIPARFRKLEDLQLQPPELQSDEAGSDEQDGHADAGGASTADADGAAEGQSGEGEDCSSSSSSSSREPDASDSKSDDASSKSHDESGSAGGKSDAAGDSGDDGRDGSGVEERPGDSKGNAALQNSADTIQSGGSSRAKAEVSDKQEQQGKPSDDRQQNPANDGHGRTDAAGSSGSNKQQQAEPADVDKSNNGKGAKRESQPKT